jgi:aryl-alcohol dehydrogenase-like predicted oxidoreductase
MDSLDILVKQGKVLYLGASDMPAWIVSACNEYAKYVLSQELDSALTIVGHITKLNSWYSRQCGMLWSEFSCTISGRELIRSRTIERDLLPMARHYNMAIIPWSSVGSGRFRNPPQLQEAIDNGTFKEGDDNVKYSRKLFEIGKRRGIESFAPVALAYLFAKYPLVFPIVGFQTPEVYCLNHGIEWC